jgi:hypothetical protein
MKNYQKKGIKKPTKIIDKLYLGAADQADNLTVLKTLGIKYILVSGNDLKQNFPQVK